MTVPCRHWSDCGVRNGGCCALGLHGGKPGIGTCLLDCERFSGDEQERATLAEQRKREAATLVQIQPFT